MKNLSAKELFFFKKNGFLIKKNFFLNEDLSKFKETLREIIRTEINKTNNKNINIPFDREFDLGMYFLENIDHKYIANISDTLYGLPEVMKLVSYNEISKIISKILLNDLNASYTPLYCNNVAAILAYPNDKNFTHSWHKDYFYTLPESNFLQIWAPLVQDSTVEIGTLRVCPGSHVNGYKGQSYYKEERFIHQYKVTNEELAKWDKIDVCLNLGDLLIFHPGLIHSGGHNLSNFTRFSLVATYHQINFSTFSVKPKKTALEYYNELNSIQNNEI